MSSSIKRDRVNFRIASDAKDKIEEAATLLGTSLSGFAVQTLVERANEVIERHNRVVLSDRDRDVFLSLLAEETPNKALRKAVQTHKRLLDE